MAKEVIVAPATSNTSNADLRIAATMTLVDYGFRFSQPLQAGRQIVRVTNAAAQGHEIEGRPQSAPIGATTPMARGEVNLSRST